MPFDDLQSTQHYRGMRVYGQSKLANILFTLELARRFKGNDVTANSLHPGTVRTGYGGDGDARGLLGLGIKIASPFFLSPAKGARTSVYLASSPEVEGVSGEYFVKCKPRQPRRWAKDAEAAQRLWQVSERARRPRSGSCRDGLTGARARDGRRAAPSVAPRSRCWPGGDMRWLPPPVTRSCSRGCRPRRSSSWT